MLIPYFSLNNSEKSNNVVVIGGGMDVKNNCKILCDYIDENKSLVISANREYENIGSNYVVFTDPNQYKKNIKNIKSRNIIINRRFKNFSVPYIRCKKYFKVCNPKYPVGAYIAKELCITDGELKYSRLGNAGFMAITVSSLCLPKIILVVGFDGFDSSFSFKYNFKGKKVRAKNNFYKEGLKKKKYLENTILPFLIKQEIQIKCFSNCNLWGVNKENIGIKDV